ncbi:MAG: winged helix DNA-binding domain-containing protein [Bacteroidales bacterium]|nr:winged helix DNA-binding domain-containing protein [Bacteroidales bacterium]
MPPTSIRLLNQHLAAPQFSLPEEVVAHFGAMQAQEYRMMRWAVAMRTKRPSQKAFTQAFDEGRIVRLHLLRGTWQLVSAADYWWMLSLCGEKARRVISGWMSSNKISLPPDEIASIRRVLIDVAERLGSATKEDFMTALSQRGIGIDAQRLSYHIRFAELDGILCSGNLLPMKASYALSEAKIPATPAMERDEMLSLLTRKYFQSHQPATLEDFVWWSGLGLTDCRRGIAALGAALHTIKHKGRDFYLLDDCRTRGFRSGNYLLIPPYDEYLIGYKSRDLVLDPAHKHRAHNNSGIFQPIVAHNGEVCGNWTPFTPTPEVTFFAGTHPTQAPITQAISNYKKYQNK